MASFAAAFNFGKRALFGGNTSSATRAYSVGDDIGAFVTKNIQQNKVMIFSKSYCPYCVKAKAVFKELQQDACIIELDEMDKGDAIQQKLLEITGQRTVPNIFVKGVHLGGCDATLAAKDSGKLLKMLE